MTEQTRTDTQASIPEATNRACAVLIFVEQERILVVVRQVQGVSAVLIVLCSTPETRVLARDVETATVAAEARWENIKTIFVYSITI